MRKVISVPRPSVSLRHRLRPGRIAAFLRRPRFKKSVSRGGVLVGLWAKTNGDSEQALQYRFKAKLKIVEQTNIGGPDHEVGGLPVDNPARIVMGAKEPASYTVSTVPKMTDENIQWEQKGAGSVAFVSGTPTGTGHAVQLRGQNVGPIAIKVTALEPDSPPGIKKPIIGREQTDEDVQVVEKQKVKVQAVIITDQKGERAVLVPRIRDDIETANLIWQQCGVEFELIGITVDLANSKFFKIMTGDVPKVSKLLETHAASGGHTIYYINEFGKDPKQGTWAGVTLTQGDVTKGLVVAADAPARVLAHELGHALGLYIDGTHAPAEVSLMYWSALPDVADLSASECSALKIAP